VNREAWLEKAVKLLQPTFTKADLTVPEIRVSVGWPSRGALSARRRTIGQCWYGEATGDSVPQVFISPALDNQAEVLATLVHEMLHAALPSDTGHKGAFVKGMKRLGLEGKPTATVAGKDLLETLEPISNKLGDFPHSKISATGGSKQTTRLIKAECPDCGYTVRVTKKWLDEAGEPICPTEREPMYAIW
jgi:hypothetical protein